MLSPAMLVKLNEQITNELNASQAYLAMACLMSDRALVAVEKLLRKQADEERGHALKFLDYILEQDGKVSVQALVQPRSDYSSVVATFEAALEHELKVTRQIHDMVTLADQERDYATRSFLQWFVDEQVEEVSSMRQIVAIARMVPETNLLQFESYVRHLLEAKE